MDEAEMRFRRFFLIKICLLPALVVFSGHPKDISTLSSTNQEFEFVFKPGVLHLEPIQVEGRSYIHADFENASVEGISGSPNIPFRSILIGIPAEGDVQVQVTPDAAETYENRRLLPVAHLEKQNGFSVDGYREGESYSHVSSIPGVYWKTGEPEVFGDQRVLRLFLYPLQFDPSLNRVFWIPRMRIRVQFEGKNLRSSRQFNPAVNETIYQSLLANYEAAKQWRIQPDRDLAKSAWTFGPGPWYRISVTQEGLYQLTGNYLKGKGVDIGDIDPATLKIYNNGGRMLHRSAGEPRAESLIENPVLLFGMEDGSFDETDYVLFFGKGITGWEFDSDFRTFNHYGNIYFDRNIYWLTFNDGVAGKRLTSNPSIPASGAQKVTRFQEHVYFEQDTQNPIVGGINWFGQLFTNDLPSHSYDISLIDLVPSDSILFRFQVYNSSSSSTYRYAPALNGEPLGTFSFTYQLKRAETRYLGAAVSGNNTIEMNFNATNTLAESYLDWFEIFYSRSLRLGAGGFVFDSPLQVDRYSFQVEGLQENGFVLDVTDLSDIHRMAVSDLDGVYGFVDDIGVSPSTYYVSNPGSYLVPDGLESRSIRNLRNPTNEADLIIISHADFYDEALRLKAHKESVMGLSVLLTDIINVYDEFSWGLIDATAIRDFMKYAWDHWQKRPGYLLLVGDGDFDYRNLLGKDDNNWIPPYEVNSYDHDRAIASDDWFTRVSGESSIEDRIPDLAVGRLPVQTREEARIVIDKIIDYEAEPVRGPWRQRLTLVGDDEYTDKRVNEWMHMSRTLYFAKSVIPDRFNINPVYLTEYPTEVTFDRRRKPKAQQALVDAFNQGTLYINYIGHGNEELWAHEWIFVRNEDLQKLANPRKLPVAYAATCTFAWWDNYQKSSFAEDLVTAEGKGVVGIIAACRECSASDNEALNERFIRLMFTDSGVTPRLGDALLGAKIARGNTANDQMYHLLGDPSLKMAIPEYEAVFTELEPDSFRALSVTKVKGSIKKGGDVWTGFQGTISLEAFDSDRNVTYTKGNDQDENYQLPGNTLFRGEARVENGQFDMAFIVPKDITYGSDMGRLSGYLYNDEADGSAVLEQIRIGGSGDIQDTRGPDIALVFDGYESFMTGGAVSENPSLVALISDDKTGINMTGDIGHNIMVSVDSETPTDVTQYFSYDEDSYLGGRLTYPLPGLQPGKHLLSLKAWDNANNSAIQLIDFEVIPGGEIRIQELLTYPNPMHEATHFTFILNRDAEVEIKVFTVSGRQIRHLTGFYANPGFNMLRWDGRDQVGDRLANGVYLYKIIAQAQDGDKVVESSEIGRLMVVHD